MNQNIVTIKGTPKCLIIYIDTEFEFFEITTALKNHISHSKGFFNGAKFKFHPSSGALTPEQCQKLEQICLAYGLTLMVETNAIITESKSPEKEPENEYKKPSGITETELQQQSHFISKSLRSGEKLAFKGNVILLGDINPGSEVVATGNIIVMGSVKGVVHAGAEGDLGSFIVASILDPMQIRIGNLIACKSEKDGSIKNHSPEIAQVDKDHIIISPYLTNALSKAN